MLASIRSAMCARCRQRHDLAVRVTDATLLTVTAFTVEPHVEEASLAGGCIDPCPAGSATCPPRQQVKRFAVGVTGRSIADPRVRRSVQSSVRLRNVAAVGSCEV